jgi:1,4-alpha-glucan branching enzyme
MGENTTMTKGFLSIVLHAHLPFVKHPEIEDCLEERWLFQAITETYIPLLKCLFRLSEDEVPYRITVSLSPTLLEMLNDKFLQERYKKYLLNLIALLEKETARVRGNSDLEHLVQMYLTQFRDLYEDYTEKLRQDLIQPWARLADSGYVELATSSATHGYLPLLLRNESIGAQIKTGLRTFRRHFGRNPQGFWVPECGYTPGIEPILREENIKYFILETHGLLFAAPRPRFGFHAPLMTPDGLLAFGRDPDCSKQVWSADEGYPGDPWYREFYKDIGYELPLDYLAQALPGNTRVPLGIKYHRITDKKSNHKEIYRPDAGLQRAWEHAGNFMFWRNKEAEFWWEVYGRRPVMVAPYDAELFGHWWYEGPLWLEYLLRRMARENQQVKTITLSEYPEHYPVNQVARPSVSSWGYKGYHEVWLEESNHWIYRHLHHCEETMVCLATQLENAGGLAKRALNQAARELLLAQASDWPFIMKTGTVPQYAKNRFIVHTGRFLRLAKELQTGSVNPVFLQYLEQVDGIFSDIDFRDFTERPEKASSF